MAKLFVAHQEHPTNALMRPYRWCLGSELAVPNPTEALLLIFPGSWLQTYRNTPILKCSLSHHLSHLQDIFLSETSICPSKSSCARRYHQLMDHFGSFLQWERIDIACLKIPKALYWGLRANPRQQPVAQGSPLLTGNSKSGNRAG